MFDATNNQDGNDSGDTSAADEFKAITTQDDLNKVINERLTRERAKFADYKDLKAKATKLDEIEQANQSESEKTAKRIADLETELSNQRRDSTRLKIAATHGITDADDIDLFLTGNDEETLTKQAKRLADRTAEKKKNGNYVPEEGKNPSPSDGGDERAYVRQLFDRANAE